MKKAALAACFVVGLGAGGAAVCAAEPGPADLAAVADKLAPSLVRIKYALCSDKGEDPRAYGYAPSGHGLPGFVSFEAEAALQDERPLQMEGFLIGPTLAVSPDPMIEPRFIEGIAARQGIRSVKATPVRYARHQNAVFLELERPLQGAKPLGFNAKAEGPYLAATYAASQGTWRIGVEPLGSSVAVTETGRRFLGGPLYGLLVTEGAEPVGLAMGADLAADGSWKGSPNQWPALEAARVEALCAGVARQADQAILRVQLGLRSPKKEDAGRFSDDEAEAATERNVPGLLVDPKRLLVLEDLPSKVTARLERIQVFRGDGPPIAAAFECTLSDYGAFLAALQEPLHGALRLADGDIRDLQRRLLVGADLRLQGENRVVYLGRRRIVGFDERWRGNLYPRVPGGDEALFLFGEDGRLVALPLPRRKKAGERGRWDARDTRLADAAVLRPILAEASRCADPSNVPLVEEEENRVAWMGVMLQALNRDLARALGVSHLTRDGEVGAIVSYVYPGSPADRAGLKPGWIIVRLHADGYPKPLEVHADFDRFSEWEFPWEGLDEVPEQMYERLPTPWPPAENSFTRMITDIGFGKAYRAELVSDGKVVFREFQVVQSPTHYGTAGRFKADSLGLTLRDMTYEVRRYLQKAESDPGVIVARVEPGSKASVAGVKPYEVVTHVNDRPVRTIKDFEDAIKGQQELRLSVKRRMTGRVVRIRMNGG
jgi:hypothetical protein